MDRLAQLASRNPHKLDELRAALPGWRLEPWDGGPLPPEEGSTYHDNARGKGHPSYKGHRGVENEAYRGQEMTNAEAQHKNLWSLLKQ